MTVKRALVTGAGGFIGSHLVESLVGAGWNVRAMVQYNSRGSYGWLDTLPVDRRRAIEILAGDVRDLAFVQKAVRECNVVMHLAALIGIPYSYRAPAQYVETNVIGTLNVLQASQDFGVERVVHTSTSEVYGSAQVVPMPETHPLVGQSPYSASKIGADQLALSFYRSFGTPVTVIRPFNAYGPRQSERAVIPTIVARLLSGERTVSLGALHPTRDYSFVEDTVRGFIAMAETKSAVEGEVVNIGSGFEVSIGDVLKIIAGIMGVDARVELDKERVRPDASEVLRLCADTTKAERLIGWKPNFGGLDGFRRGLEKTVKWFRARAVTGEPALPSRYAV